MINNKMTDVQICQRIHEILSREDRNKNFQPDKPKSPLYQDLSELYDELHNSILDESGL